MSAMTTGTTPPAAAAASAKPRRLRPRIRREDGTVMLPVKVLIFLAVVLFPMASIIAAFKLFGPAR